MIREYLSIAAVAAVVSAGGPSFADEVHSLQGLFCNTEAQIDNALAGIANGVSLRRAADLANRDAVVCTYVDRIEFLIVRPVVLSTATIPLVKYRGSLIGVSVGGVLKPVTPASEVYFLTTEQIASPAIELRT
jgi:hypothetical protein